MPRFIENYKNYWILTSEKGYLYTTADKNYCNTCNDFTWITNITCKTTNNNKQQHITHIALCKPCIEISIYKSKPHHCPFHNKHVNEENKICIECIDKMKQATEILYESSEINILSN
jgi:hypothetical protein